MYARCMREASVSLWLVVSAVMNASAPRRSIDSFLDKCAEGGAEENKYGRSSMDRGLDRLSPV